MDFREVQQVGTLVASLTQAQSTQLDPELLSKLKGLLRCSDELVEYTQARLMDRLAANNAQVGTHWRWEANGLHRAQLLHAALRCSTCFTLLVYHVHAASVGAAGTTTVPAKI
eukprot:GHRQ01021470.1.p3 GENE.GHRQ01021470.1~~GHRQ01021470.1.p3  ORF type:complete len:113 (+),score=46.60 GHRQ01021470.1:247-585(+)